MPAYPFWIGSPQVFSATAFVRLYKNAVAVPGYGHPVVLSGDDTFSAFSRLFSVPFTFRVIFPFKNWYLGLKDEM